MREVTRDGDGNEYYFNASSVETRGNDPPHRRDSHDNTRVDEGNMNPYKYSSHHQTPENQIGDASNRNVAKQNENDNTAAGLTAEGVLQPWEGGQIEGGAEDADAAFSGPVLPSGWEAVVADDDGSVFYHHIASGVTQWEVPQQQAQENTETA